MSAGSSATSTERAEMAIPVQMRKKRLQQRKRAETVNVNAWPGLSMPTHQLGSTRPAPLKCPFRLYCPSIPDVTPVIGY